MGREGVRGEDPGPPQLSWERRGIPPDELAEVAGCQRSLGVSAETVASMT